MKIFTHEQTQDLLARLRAFRAWVQDSEYRANEKSFEVWQGIQALEKAEAFIADLDAEVTEKADRLSMHWAVKEETEEDLPIRIRMIIDSDKKT